MSPEEKRVARRLAAQRRNGRKGGLATAERHSQEWLLQRARMGGSTTRDLYSADFFGYINSKREARRGWPMGKNKTMRHKVSAELVSANLSPLAKQIFQQMLAATK